MADKKNIAVLFGGQSSEHEVSCVSAQTIMQNIDTDQYEIWPIGITKEGHWVYEADVQKIADGTWRESPTAACISPDASEKCLYLLRGNSFEKVQLDVVFPVLHGLYGEDGTVQGIFTLAGIPFVGCGVLASAVSMDKIYTKLIVDSLGIRQAAYVPVHRNDLRDMDQVIFSVESKLDYPIFVKPSCAGSSVGVSKAEDREGLKKALLTAAREDSKILCEETIVGREIECAVYGTEDITKASGVGEILAAAEFYDYEAKYHDAESKTLTDPVFPEGVEDEVREKAMRIFRGVNGYGLSRVDFFLDAKGVVFNEINTLPGFTGISMYPMLFEKAGIPKKELVQMLIDSAYQRKEH